MVGLDVAASRRSAGAVKGVVVVAACTHVRRGARQRRLWLRREGGARGIGGKLGGRAARPGGGQQARTEEVRIAPFARVQRVVAVAAEEATIVPTTGVHRVVAVAACAKEPTGSSSVARRG